MTKFLTPIDLNQNELRKALIENYAGNPNTTPVPGVSGQVIYDSTNKKLYQHNGTTWIEVGIVYTHPNHSGDVTSTGDGATAIGANKVTNGMLAQIAVNTIKGRKTTGTGNVEDLSAADVRGILNVENGAQVNTVNSVNAQTGAVVLGHGDVGAAAASHAHGSVTSDGKIGTTATKPIITGTGGVLQAGSFGTASGTFCQGNDSRLSDARTPTSHDHGQLSNSGQMLDSIGEAGKPIITGTNGFIMCGSFGSSANTFCQGNDSRLSDSRTPTNHNLINTTHHPVSGLTTGHFLKATGATSYGFAAHGLGKADVGLGNVTNDAQVKKLASSTSGNVPTWSGANGDALAAGYGVETTLTGGTGNLARADAIKTYIDNNLGSLSGALVFKGTLGSGGTYTALPTTYSVGWTIVVITAGTYAGRACEVEDKLIAVVARSGSGNLNSDWVVSQGNIDGAVIGPLTATDGNIPLFDGITGKLIKNSTVSPASFAAAAHNHDGTYPKKYSVQLGNTTSQVITHNLNSRDVTVSIRETASPYAMVMADIEFTTVNTLTVKFAVAPSAGEYTITVIG